MKYQVYNQTGEKTKQVELNPAVFGVEINEGLVHQVVVAQMANARQPLAHTKDRSEVHGGGRKPWRQKGTGRARHGSIRSPLWVGGGVTFGPSKERNFAKKINKKMKRKALFMCLTDRANDKNLVLLDKLEIKDSKTKEFVKVVRKLRDVLKLQIKNKKPVNTEDTERIQRTQKKVQSPQKNSESSVIARFDIKDYKISILVVTDKDTAKVLKIARNIPGINVLSANSLNVVDVLKYKNLLMTENSLKVLEKTYLSKV